MKTETADRILTCVDNEIVRTLLYYDIFNYPLKLEEIVRFLGINSKDELIIRYRLSHLKEQQLIFQFGNFFSLKNDHASVDRRLKGNQEAERYLVIAQKQARLISKFPFVRGVLASGSLSKGFMDENSDLDFFIITSPGRLWIARTLLVMYKRIFLLNSHKYFCVNYFVDEDHLEIEEKNLFTATELATVLPLYGSEQYENLHQTNSWLMDFFPNYKRLNSVNVPIARSSVVKRILERFFNLFFASYFERYFRHKTLSRWKKLYQRDYAAADFQVAFKSKAYAAKNHDKNFQRKIMDLYEEKLKSKQMDIESTFEWSSRLNSTLSNKKAFSNSTAGT